MRIKSPPMNDEPEAAIKKARARGPMTTAEIQEQRISFAWGNLPDGNPITKEQVRKMDYAKHGNLQDTK